MGILEDKNYIIRSTFYSKDSPDEGPGMYIGTVQELRKTIATTWSKVPHSVKINANSVVVSSSTTHQNLAVFIFTELTRQKIPDHF